MNNIVKVDMIPKSFGVKTLSCSQGDTKREFKFTLNDANETIDTSDVEIALPQFPVYKNGTEEILPTNGSVPSTAPIIADIRYPQGLLTDQEFTYRQSPTEEDGLAKITDIKGNTIVWNQLVQNGNFADTSNWTTGNATLSVASNKATLTVNNSGTVPFYQTINQKTAGHKILVLFNAYASRELNLTVNWGNQLGPAITLTTSNQRFAVLYTLRTGGNNNFNLSVVAQTGDVINYSNVQLFDLTQMGLDSITGQSEFTSLFPLSYYDYNQGSLLSFNGNGIKTTGKNLLSYSGENLPYNANGVSITREDNIYKVVASNPSGYPFARISTIHYLPKGQYTVTMLGAESSNTGVAWRLIDRNVSPVKIFVNASATTTTFTLNEDAHDVYFEITIDASKLTTGTWDVRFQLNMGTPSGYEPYTSTTTSLPISTYFPTGMKRAGNVYDELTENKAITRVGMVDLGTVDWAYNSNGFMYSGGIIDLIAKPSASTVIANIASTIQPTTAYTIYDGGNGIGIHINGQIRVRIDNMSTDPVAFKQSLSGVYLYYELATETETEITSASLVTENGEIQLLPQDGYLVGTVNSSVSRKSGMFDAKVKLTDGDGKVYSNKLQLYVERSPK